MIENKQDTSLNAQTEVTAPVQEQPPKVKHRTVGNIIYDFGIYGSIAWVGVAALSLLSAHESKFGNNKMFGWLRWIDKNATAGFKKVFSKTPGVKSFSKETVDGLAEGSTMFLTLGMGGHALMAPLKWMEDNRQKNAALIDNVLGTTPPDPETIEKEPKQTWKSVFSGRMFSWALSYVAFLALTPKLTSTISHKCGEAFTNGWMKIRPSSNPETVRKWANIGAFDALFTVITALVTYGFSRYVAKHDDVPDYTPAALPPAESAPAVSNAAEPAKKSFVEKHPPKVTPAKHNSFSDFATAASPELGHAL